MKIIQQQQLQHLVTATATLDDSNCSTWRQQQTTAFRTTNSRLLSDVTCQLTVAFFKCRIFIAEYTPVGGCIDTL